MMNILFASDFSEIAHNAARVAALYARRFGARLHLLHVVWPDATAQVHAKLEKLAQEVAADLPTIVAVRVGVPGAEIVDYAAANAIDLIVVGTHGRTGMSLALTGSVAERVVRTARCPVLTVPRDHRGGNREPTGTVREPRCIVCSAVADGLVCEPCRARIRGEALGRKLREEKGGRTA